MDSAGGDVEETRSLRWARHAAIITFSAGTGYVALAIGSLALSPWGSGRTAGGCLFFMASAAFAAAAVALYPYILWKSSGRRSHAAAALASVVAVVAVAAMVAATA